MLDHIREMEDFFRLHKKVCGVDHVDIVIFPEKPIEVEIAEFSAAFGRGKSGEKVYGKNILSFFI
jgi:hypothetical protein